MVCPAPKVILDTTLLNIRSLIIILKKKKTSVSSPTIMRFETEAGKQAQLDWLWEIYHNQSYWIISPGSTSYLGEPLLLMSFGFNLFFLT